MHLQPEETGPDICFSPVCEQLAEAGVLYTIVKYGDLRQMGEGKYPYRIVRGALPLPILTPSNSPVGSFSLSSQDLYRVSIALKYIEYFLLFGDVILFLISCFFNISISVT